jgi:hypothetical protein
MIGVDLVERLKVLAVVRQQDEIILSGIVKDNYV